MWIQVAITLFSAFALVRIYAQLKERRLSPRIALIWMLLWLSVIIVFWLPGIASQLALYAGIGRGADLVVYVAIIILMYLQYRFFERLERLHRDVTTLTRQLALRDGTKKENSSDSDR